MSALLAASLLALACAVQAPPRLDAVDVKWTTPSEDAAGSMPVGNGEVVLNAWVENGTGDVLFYIGRSDSLSEISRILKLGLVRIHFSPNPFAKQFMQHLHLRDGCIEFAGIGFDLTLFVDSETDVIHLKGESRTPMQASIKVECWRNEPRTLPKDEMGSAWSARDAPFPLVESADRFEDAPDRIVWYHRNESSVVPALWNEQSLEHLPGRWDPILNRTFGGVVQADGFQTLDRHELVTPHPQRNFDIRIASASEQTATVADWIAHVDKALENSPTPPAWRRTMYWWAKFWDRSWVFVDTPSHPATGTLITQGYVLQRYVQACQGRGTYPIKFNGGYYTVEPKAMGMPYDADFRNWGDSEWYQNLRHTVAPMLEQGDTEMMDPFFRFYEQAVPLCEERAKSYYDAEGVYFPETMTDFGTYSGGDYGWDRRGLTPGDVECPWWANARNQGLELVSLMLDRYDYTYDQKFLRSQLLPMAEAVLRWFDTRYKRDGKGRIVLDPTQAVETYWTGVVNDMPTVAGLISDTERLCALPDNLVTQAQAEFYRKMRASCPELPMQKFGDRMELAPAQKYDNHTSNVENPELYAVWPFRLVDLGHPTLLAEGRLAYANRKNHLDVGWGYDGNVAALLGLTEEASRILLAKCENSHAGYRWPATWGPNFDWLPDQNHGGNLLNTCNLMLLQGGYPGEKLRILPAWPKDWDVDFKLHAPGGRVVRVVYRGGKIERREVQAIRRRQRPRE